MRRLSLVWVILSVFWASAALSVVNHKTEEAVAQARNAGLSKATLNAFLDNVDTYKFPPRITQKVLQTATKTQQAGAPGNQLLLKAIEGMVKGATVGQIDATVRKLGEELRKIAQTMPKDMSPRAKKKAILAKYKSDHPTNSDLPKPAPPKVIKHPAKSPRK